MLIISCAHPLKLHVVPIVLFFVLLMLKGGDLLVELLQGCSLEICCWSITSNLFLQIWKYFIACVELRR